DRLEIRSLRADVDGEHLVAKTVAGDSDDGAQRDHDGGEQRPLSAPCHARSAHRARSSLISAAASPAENTALPATNVSAPAFQTFWMVSRLIPPSTSRAAVLFASRSTCRARVILSNTAGMNFCPPNPGL